MSLSYNRPRPPENADPAQPVLHIEADTGAPSTPDDVSRFLDRVYQAVSRGDTDGATDEVFDRVDDLLERGDYAACDRILRQADLDRLDSNLMVAFLAITLPAREHLREREPLYRGVKQVLIGDRGKEAVGEILRGLE